MPLDVLKEAWCSRCANPECTRSTVGTTKMERRVQDWEKKLFLDPPRMDPSDPLYATIAARKFITIDPGRTPEVRSDWVDPRDLQEPQIPAIVPKAFTVAPSIEEKIEAPASPTPAPPREAPPATAPKPMTSPRSVPLAILGANAADQSGKILRGAPEDPSNKGDPWAAPEPPKPGEVVVQPGAKIKMGGGSGV
jgi:hypothetical protein